MYTKGEWKYDNALEEVFAESGDIIADLFGPNMSENGKRIVTCVNSHDALVEACKAVLDDYHASCNCNNCEWCKVKQAINKVEGKV